MRRSAGVVLVGLAAGLIGCSPADSDESGSDGRSPMMSGGTRARPGQFPPTVYIPSCTAAKIGRRELLTAAHCVVDPSTMALRPEYRRGGRFTLWTGVDLEEHGRPFEVEVRGTRVHPSYAARLVAAGGDGIESEDFTKVDDLAVIRLEADTPEIAAGVLSHARLAVGARIVVGGYGLTQDRFTPSDGTFIVEAGGEPPRAGLQAAPARVWATEGTVQKIRNGKELENGEQVIRDGLSPETDLKLLPGDSGGPVYRDDRAAGADYASHVFRIIVGVNSFSGLFESAFARIDDAGPGPCLRAALRSSVDDAPRLGQIPVLCSP